MRALAYWKAVTTDRVGFLDRLLALLSESRIRYCLIGGQAVNAYVEPVVSLDLDIAVVTEEPSLVEALLSKDFSLARFPHSLNVSQTGSDLRVQIQTDPRYSDFVGRAALREVLGLTLPVAAIEDVLQGKVWAVRDPGTDQARGRRTWPTSRGCSKHGRICGTGFRKTSSSA